MGVILLVDDNQDNRAMYCAVLKERGHVCHEAEHGQIGLEVAHEVRPDLILLDIGMPVMDGWETILALKLSPVTSSIPVVALTAHVLREDEVRAEEAGFDAFIRKPAPPSHVADVVERILAAVGK